MIPMRIRMFFLAALHNIFSYSYQFLESAYYFLVEVALDSLSSLSEGLYSFFFSHHEAFKERIRDKRSRTSYIKDGYGRRYRVVSPATKEFHAINCEPILRRRIR